MGYYAGTTPTIKFTFEDFNPSVADSILLTFATNARPFLELSESDLIIDSTSVTAKLTQAQSLSIPLGPVKVQINFLLDSGTRVATNIVTINVAQNLHMAIME